MIKKNLSINTQKKGATIKKEIYGHFSEHLGRCIFGGIYVGEDSDIPNTRGLRNDVLQALKDMAIKKRHIKAIRENILKHKDEL